MVNLVAVSTQYDLFTVNVPNAGNGVRFSVESYQTLQGVGHAGQFNEWLAHWDGGTWVFTSIGATTTVAGFTFTPVSVDINNFRVQVQRTVGGASNTPFRALATVRQAANNMEGNEVVVSST